MLIRFRVQNFRSLRDEQELSLVASSLRELGHVVRHPRGIAEGLLPVAAIYGANASGKTNVLMALAFMEEAVRNSHKSWSPEGPISTEPFRLDEESARSPTRFSVDLLIGSTRFEYGFALTPERVVEEWLHAYPTVRKQVWFRRDSKNVDGRKFAFSKHLSGENQAIANLTRNNSLFLSAAAQNNHEQLLPIYQWFAHKLHFVNDRGPLVTQTADYCKKEDGLRAKVSAAMSAADLGIVGMDVAEEAMDEKFQTLIKTFTQAALTLYPDQAGSQDWAMPTTMPKIVLLHKGSRDKPLAFTNDSESAGTLAWFGLLGPVFRALERGRTLCVDELDSSLHPVLAVELVRMFNDPAKNPHNAQLIFNTHDTNLLDPKLFRRDQIWFTEKDPDGASHLYPLTDFKPRKQENLERGYLQGRYGAIPFVGSLESILSADDDAAER